MNYIVILLLVLILNWYRRIHPNQCFNAEYCYKVALKKYLCNKNLDSISNLRHILFHAASHAISHL